MMRHSASFTPSEARWGLCANDGPCIMHSDPMYPLESPRKATMQKKAASLLKSTGASHVFAPGGSTWQSRISGTSATRAAEAERTLPGAGGEWGQSPASTRPEKSPALKRTYARGAKSSLVSRLAEDGATEVTMEVMPGNTPRVTVKLSMSAARYILVGLKRHGEPPCMGKSTVLGAGDPWAGGKAKPPPPPSAASSGAASPRSASLAESMAASTAATRACCSASRSLLSWWNLKKGSVWRRK
mmetsp:Transcript_22768/g.49905  ORF Transcript_22768/g.49905 Transcript_22768/m.49905 type:complete len:243 (+) Transcript_22768:1006-1734(+)